MESRGWHLFLPFSMWCLAFWISYNLPKDWSVVAAAYYLHTHAIVLSWQINAGIIERKLREHTGNEKPVAPKPEPVHEIDGFKPIIRQDGKPIYAFKTDLVKINHERRMASILWMWRENNYPIKLTEEYWVKQKNFFKRSEFANDIMVRWDRNGVTRRINGRKNSPRDILDWSQVERMARGGALPR